LKRFVTFSICRVHWVATSICCHSYTPQFFFSQKSNKAVNSSSGICTITPPSSPCTSQWISPESHLNQYDAFTGVSQTPSSRDGLPPSALHDDGGSGDMNNKKASFSKQVVAAAAAAAHGNDNSDDDDDEDDDEKDGDGGNDDWLKEEFADEEKAAAAAAAAAAEKAAAAAAKAAAKQERKAAKAAAAAAASVDPGGSSKSKQNEAAESKLSVATEFSAFQVFDGVVQVTFCACDV
jgi:hypothetical protein